MKTINPNAKPWILGFALFVLLVILLLCNGCSPARKIERATERVMLNPAARHYIFLTELSLFPCANDTAQPVIIPGRIDTFPVSVLVRVTEPDTAGVAAIVDSLNTTHTKACNTAIRAAYDLGQRDAAKLIGSQTVFIPRPDTAKFWIVDRRLVALKEDSINSLLRQKAALNQAVADVSGVATENKKQGNTYMLWLIAAIAALVLSNGLWIKLKIFKI